MDSLGRMRVRLVNGNPGSAASQGLAQPLKIETDFNDNVCSLLQIKHVKVAP
jgi:hypothetical protein